MGLPNITAKIPLLSTAKIVTTSFVLRLAFLLYGLYQDKYLDLPYTDIDYFVFTDASRFVYQGQSPYLRDTYRYTPLLSWLLYPTAFPDGVLGLSHAIWFEFGKLVFVGCDLITGILILKLLKQFKRDQRLSLIWFWNPMVITISTRGSSESLMTCFVLLFIWLLVNDCYSFAGLVVGFSIHLKIYPFIYVPAALLVIDSHITWWKFPITINRLKFLSCIAIVVTGLTWMMYQVYGMEFLNEAYYYHLIRLDHRHNFSVYNLSLYFTSFTGHSALHLLQKYNLKIEQLALIPQVFLSVVLIPLSLLSQGGSATLKEDFISSLFIQTFTFITYNKVITSQYFIWFLCLLPNYLAASKLSGTKGFILLIGWVITQALWLSYGYRLEFLGESNVFTYGIWTSSLLFFFWNVVITGQLIQSQRAQLIKVKPKKE